MLVENRKLKYSLFLPLPILLCDMIKAIQQLSPAGFRTDSREVKSGDLFFALKGQRSDAHAFLSQVADKGAAGAVVQNDYAGPSYGLALFPVSDVLHTLQMLARDWLAHCGARVVAVTGSVGKTTTKEFIAALLRQKYKVASSPGNSNSQVGLPLSILNNVKETDQILVQEMGMSEAGQLSRLIAIAPPEVAVLTMVALVHACNFDSLKAIALAKGEIFGSPQTKLGILLKECDSYEEVCRIGTCPKITFSIKDPAADYYLGKELFVEGKFAMAVGELPVPGEHNRQNLLAAIAVAGYFDLDREEIAKGVRTLVLPERRLQLVEKNGVRFINDSYNASTVSMKASFETLPKPAKGNKTVAVLGEMLELGEFSEMCHREVGEAALNVVDNLICYGPGCRPLAACWQAANKPVAWTCDRAEMMKLIKETVKPGDVVLLKGARANELWKVLEEI